MGGNAARALVAALVVLALVAVVAVASTGSTPSGSGDARPPADVLLDTFFSLALLALIPAAAMLVYGLMQRKEIAREIASGRYRRSGIGVYIVLIAAVALAFYLRLNDVRFDLRGGQGEVVDTGDQRAAATPEGVTQDGRVYEPEFAWIPVLVVVVLVAAAVVAYRLASRRRRRLVETEVDVAEQVAETLAETLDDLRAEPDPRRAVVAAYARLERALAAAGLPRRRSETAEEYVARILDGLEVDRVPVRRLTDLFEAAKFSQHTVDGAMKEEAISALEQIRHELREVARRRREEREDALGAPEEAAAS